MNKKWLLFLIPVSLIIMTESVSGQSSQISNAVAGTERTQLNNSFLPDTTFTPVPKDSAFANVQVGWKKFPGQMPIYFFGLPPNSIPILNLPLVDEEMIIPVKSEKVDSIKTSNKGGN